MTSIGRYPSTEQADYVLNDIRSAALAIDDRLPSEFEMADQYGVSRDVIRRAKEELAAHD
jgi:DNA-binding GntR family transcriptional regulator